MMSSSFSDYDVFISHAGEDKIAMAFPLRDKLSDLGIKAFVDERDMAGGTWSEEAMTEAMKTATIAVVILSPEFVARKWPMRELLCFLRRSVHTQHPLHEDERPLSWVIPLFYRLSIKELYNEPRFDRLDTQGKQLYIESRFFERNANGEPEANVDIVKEALLNLRQFMGVTNYMNATNENTPDMYKRRDDLLKRLCNEVQKAFATESRKNPSINVSPQGESSRKDLMGGNSMDFVDEENIGRGTDLNQVETELENYISLRDIVIYIAKSPKHTKEENRALLTRKNITELSPAISAPNWTFRFVEISGESLYEIDSERFLKDTEYAKERLKFARAMELPKEDANPSVIKAPEIYNSGRIPLQKFKDRLYEDAKKVFKQLELHWRDVREISERLQGYMKSSSQILRSDPYQNPQYCNQQRWDDCGRAKLGTITNWLGDRVTLNNRDLDQLLYRIESSSFGLQRRSLLHEEKMFVYELMLVVVHAFDTVQYLTEELSCEEIVDISHVRWVFHDNGGVPKSLSSIQNQVNGFSFDVLLPLFFTKQLYVHRSNMLAKLRHRLVQHHNQEKKVLTGNVQYDSNRMRSNVPEASEIREVSSIVCISDLLGDEDLSMVRTYGHFPKFESGEVCPMPSCEISMHYPQRVNARVGHILGNVGRKGYRTQLDKSLKPGYNSTILAGADFLVLHAMAREAVVYTNDPAWGTDIIGGVMQPIRGSYQCCRHRLLAYLALVHMVSVNEDEEEEMQDFVLSHVASLDSEKLMEIVVDFVYGKLMDRKNKNDDRQDIMVSEIEAAARYISGHKVDRAVIEREMIHYLVTEKIRLVPKITTEEIEGCYFKALYNDCKIGNGKLLVNKSIPLAGLSTAQGNNHQLYTIDERVLTSEADLTTRSNITRLRVGGDINSRNAYPVLIAGDLFAA